MVDKLGIDTIFIFCDAGGVVGTDDMLDLYEINVSFLGVPKGPEYCIYHIHTRFKGKMDVNINLMPL